MISRDIFSNKSQAHQIYSSFVHSELKNWIMVYPIYINSKKPISRGRLIPLSKCVDSPSAKEIANVLLARGFHTLLEDKKIHPKESFRDDLHRGRVRVQFWDNDEKQQVCLYPEFPSRKSLLIFIAEQISKLESRKNFGKVAQPYSKLTESKTKIGYGKIRKSKKHD
ncbi:Signal recognition particle 19 kDa protein [Oopsacas minuta]|uniref:Signal recognition particle 19 kDa protein n=1 Tax=Oopsacas minuta TaxID=111878 RepID=A0AAV7K7B0_9METZ|nr:Signal recognition particle 19 kDa protein [Oopsacas minuta]